MSRKISNFFLVVEIHNIYISHLGILIKYQQIVGQTNFKIYFDVLGRFQSKQQQGVFISWIKNKRSDEFKMSV